MIKKLFSFSILIVCSFNASSQELEGWKVFPSFSTVNSISVDEEENVYAATLGGIFAVSDGEIITQLTTMEGLYRSNPSTIIVDEANRRLITGYIDGTIEVIGIESNNIERLEDIKRVTRFNSKSINAFKIYQNKLYTATSFGMVVYNLESLLVENSFSKLGSFDIGTQVNGFDITADSIFVATTQGVAIGNLNENLVESDNWENHDETNGLPLNVVESIVSFYGAIHVLIEDSVYTKENLGWDLNTDFANGSVISLQKNSNQQSMAAATSSNITIVNTESELQSINLDFESSITTFMLNGEKLYVGTSNEGVAILENLTDDPDFFLPSGPYLNFFTKVLIDNSKLISTSTVSFPGSDPLNSIRGYYIFSEENWRNFNINTHPELRQYRFLMAYSVGANDSSYYIGSWGRGIARHRKSDDKITVYNRSNSNLSGISANSNFVVISGLASDSQNNMWAVSFNSEFPLYVQLSETEEWIPFRSLSESDQYFNLFVDSFDQKWISLINVNNLGRGLLIVDTGAAEDPNDDRSVKLTSSINNGNLPDEKINTIIQDKNREVWIGTGRGIARFIFPELIVDGGPEERQAQWLINEDTAATSRFLLRDVNVTSMAVNDANQKWIGSENQGLWLLNEEGSRIERRFTTENSDLISDNIESIAIDNETGIVFVATDLGLISFQDIPKAPVNEMEKLKVFPNPFQYSRHSQIVIEGLSEETQIKILGIDGIVVNEMTARGGRVSWDGFDYNGNRVGTGVYYVVAYEDSGRERGIGKVVIIK